MLKEFSKHLIKMGKSPHTVRSYLGGLKKAIDEGIINNEISYVDTKKLINLELSPASKNRLRASIRKYCDFLVENQRLEKAPENLKALSIPKINRKLPRIAHSNDVKKLITTAPNKEIKLILLILSTTGCRVSSLVNLKIEHMADNAISFHTSKGGKAYTSILTKETKETFMSYIEDRTNGYIFLNKKGLKISENSLRNKLARKLGKDYKNPHSLRHGVATELIGNGADIYLVSKFLNHTSVTTTENYIHLESKNVLEKLKGKHPFIT